jgi:Ca2+-transporting ATPase
MTTAELKEKMHKTNIFARVVPEQKLMIVEALKSHGEIVGMTGDGVNDAPALKAASIGVAMGGRGTDVARESADLVLLNDDFSSIVAAVRLGRRIFDNLKKAMAYIISIHIPIAGVSLLPVLFNWPTILYPVHIVFLELIIDPACSIVFEMEEEEENVMNRKPRNPKEPLFGKKMLTLSAIQGLFALIIVIFIFYFSQKTGHNVNDARALSFMTLIVCNLSLIFTNRSWSSSFRTLLNKPNKAFKWVCGGALLFLVITLYIPFFQRVFKFGTIHLHDLPIAFGLGIASILWFEFLKRFSVKKHKILLKD